MSALSEKERIHVMNAVNAVETLMLRMMRPDKVNLASLGNHGAAPTLARYSALEK